MNRSAIISTIIVAGIALVALYEMRNDVRNKDAVIRNAEQRIKEERRKADSLNAVIQITRDSLEIAFATIRAKQSQVETAYSETAKARKQLESIKFKKTTRDSERDSILRKLYPSLKQ